MSTPLGQALSTFAVFIILLLTTNCSEESIVDSLGEEYSVEDTDSVAVGLGVSFNKGYTTRMSAAATQSDERFRGINDFLLIPYATQDEIGPNDKPLKHLIDIGRTVSESRIISNNNATLYKPVFVPRRTASFLVYGHAPASDDPFQYGALSGFGSIDKIAKTSDISFTLDHIYSETGTPAIAQEIADYLTSIATIQYALPTAYYGDIFYRVQHTPIYRWSDSDSYNNSELADLFSFFSNGDRVMSGSSASISHLLTMLYNRLYNVAYADQITVDYYANNSISTPIGTIYPYRELATAIRTAIANTDFVYMNGYGDNVTISLKSPRNNYPANIHLPDGATGIQWNASEQKYQVQMQTKASAKLMSANRFCYPPFLCYYANSLIKTSDADSEEEHYVSTNSWNQILDEYRSSYTFVNSQTRAIAIKNKINYGVAQLRVNLRCPSKLYDQGNIHEIMVTGDNFPMTAIIVGPQYDVAYNFDPLLSSEDHMIYDPRVVDSGNYPIYMLPYNQTTAFTQTLVLPTKKDEVVYLILEFENNSKTDFYGANGLILKGSKFYMMAKLDPSTASGYNPEDNTMNRVFSQDGYTEVTCVVNDLKGAWNVVPDTRDPQLEIGVSMETKWTHSTTTNVLLY